MSQEIKSPMENVLAEKSTRRQFLKVAASGAAVFVVGACAPKPRVGAKPVTVKFFHMEPDPKTVKVVEDAAKAFKDKYPNISVVSSVFGWTDLELKVMAAMAAGSPPEIADTFVHHVGWAIGRGLLRPLDDVYEATGGKKQWFDELVNWVRGDGRVWALPWTWGSDMLLTRDDFAKEAGLKDPQNWDEFLAWAKAVSKPPERYGFHLAGNAALWFNEDVFEFLGQQGGQLWDDDGLPAFVSPEMNDVLEYYKKLTEVMPPGWMADGYTETMNTIALGKVASARLWGRTVGYIEQYAPKEKQNPETFRVMRAPMGTKSKNRTMQANDDVLVVYSNSKNPDEAAEFLKFFLTNEWNKKSCLSVPVHLVPPIRSVLEDPEYKTNPYVMKWKNWLDVQWETLKAGDGKPLMMLKDRDKTIPYVTDIANAGILGDMVVSVITKGVKPEDAMKMAQAKAMKLIAEIGPLRKKG